MMRKPLSLCTAILLVGLVAPAFLALAETPPETGAPARLTAVGAVEQPQGVLLEVQASGPFRYASYQPRQGNLVVDLTGVVSDRGALEPAAGVPWVSGYRLLPFRNASGDAVVRLDITLKSDCAVELTQPQPNALWMACAGSGSPPPAAAEQVPAETTPAPPAPAVMAPMRGGTIPEEPVVVQTVAVAPQSDPLTVTIHASGPLAFETRILSNPTRLVIDLPQSVLGARQRNLTVGRDGVVGVRMAQFQANPPVTRVVVDLKELVEYNIAPTPDGLRLTLGAAAAAQPEPPAAVSASVQVPVSAPATEEAAPEPVLVASLAPTVPSSLRASSSPPPMEPAATIPAPASTTPEPPPAPEATDTTPEEQVIQAAPASPQATRRYTGEPISVNLKDVDLKDFFRLIHEISGLNIIVDPNVRGSVTMVLIDVPWDQALDIVLKNNSLGATLEGNVLRIATLDTLKKEQETQRDLAKARAEAVDPVTVPRQLSYAKASEMESVLRRFLSSRGEIIRDDRTNTIIIRDIPSVIPEVDNLIRQLDRKSLQVEIEARVVSASRAFVREIGTSLATAFTTTGGRSLYGGGLAETSPIEGPISAPIEPLPFVTNFPVAATSGFLFGHRSPNFALDFILTAAENRDIAKVLSRPRLITQNNIRAQVQQGTRIPVQTVVNNTISTQFISVVLKLEVKPQITAEGTIFLDIDIENTAIDPGIARINGIPALATQQTTTQVLIADGGTVVVGGVMVTNNSTNVAQVPLLGSIPVLGHLFKSTRVRTDTRELLFFITPRILPG
ncbi:MAG: type IV pilus secretin PilQ [Acidobacteria bacterium]|nr:type IV pilus secretin PilQ [Acidobacteriota bacterium]